MNLWLYIYLLCKEEFDQNKNLLKQERETRNKWRKYRITKTPKRRFLEKFHLFREKGDSTDSTENIFLGNTFYNTHKNTLVKCNWFIRTENILSIKYPYCYEFASHDKKLD